MKTETWCDTPFVDPAPNLVAETTIQIHPSPSRGAAAYFSPGRKAWVGTRTKNRVPAGTALHRARGAALR